MADTAMTVLLYGALVVLTLASVEVLAFSVLVALDLRDGRPLGLAFKNRLREHPWTSPRFAPNMTDPIKITRLNINTVRDNGRVVNAFGFTENGAPVSAFPGKPPGVYRIVFFGGSSGEGVGLPGHETITAHLERRLNEDGRLGPVQALNFAVSGGSSWTAVSNYFSEVTHYQPDAVIMLEGWNEVVNARMEHRRRGVPHPILNWPMAAYEHYDYWNNLPTVTIAGSHAPVVMTWTYILVERWLPKRPVSERIEEAYRQHPVYNFTRTVVAHDPSLAEAFASNVEAVGAHAAAKGRLFFGYLQPFANFGKPLSAEEEQRLDNFHANHDREHPNGGWDRASATRTFTATFEAYAAALREVQSRHDDNPRFRLFDIRQLFADHPETLYQDMIHYNGAGAAVLAARMATDILVAAGKDHPAPVHAESAAPAS